MRQQSRKFSPIREYIIHTNKRRRHYLILSHHKTKNTEELGITQPRRSSFARWSHQGQSLVEFALDFVSEAVGVGGQLEVVLGVALLCNKS